MVGISSKAAGNLQNKKLFNGKEKQTNEFSDGSGLEWYEYGARMYDDQIGRWLTEDPLAFKYFSTSPFVFVSNNPIAWIDPNGKEIIGVTKDDGSKAKEDLQKLLKGDKFSNLRNLITLKKNGRTIKSLDKEAVSKALDGQNLSPEEQALVNTVTNTINSKDKHVIEYKNMAENISETGEDAFKTTMPLIINNEAIKEKSGGIPVSIISSFGGGGITTKTNGGTYSLMVEDYNAKNTDYYNSVTKNYVSNPGGREVTMGHEILGHGRSLALGRESSQSTDAIQMENLILRVLGSGNIQRDGTNHGDKMPVVDPSRIPAYQ